MATRRMTPEDWSPATTSTSTFSRSSIEPRDERVQIPRTRERAALRPKPLNIATTRHIGPSPPELKAPPPSRKESSESQCENLRDPEVVDSAFSEAWTARDSALRTRRPSITSRNSTRQSEISLGIIDYYMRDHTPAIPSPELPPTPKIDPAIDRFDFGLPPTPTPSAAPRFPDSPPAKAGAERTGQLVPISPPTRPPASTNNSYRLFPVIKQVTPPPRFVLSIFLIQYPPPLMFPLQTTYNHLPPPPRRSHPSLHFLPPPQRIHHLLRPQPQRQPPDLQHLPRSRNNTKAQTPQPTSTHPSLLPHPLLRLHLQHRGF